MASAIEHAATTVLEEAVDEFYGKSKRSWALILLAFVLGGVVAVVLAARYRTRVAAETVDGPEADATVTPSAADAAKRSGWSYRRAQLARSEAMMRGRVGRAGSRLNVRRHASLDENAAGSP